MEPLFSGVQKGNGRDNLAHFSARVAGKGGTTWALAAAGLQGRGRGKGDLLSGCREVKLGLSARRSACAPPGAADATHARVVDGDLRSHKLAVAFGGPLPISPASLCRPIVAVAAVVARPT